jgi:hypothetical protein
MRLCDGCRRKGDRTALLVVRVRVETTRADSSPGETTSLGALDLCESCRDRLKQSLREAMNKVEGAGHAD